jgi:hypothetical protein
MEANAAHMVGLIAALSLGLLHTLTLLLAASFR